MRVPLLLLGVLSSSGVVACVGTAPEQGGTLEGTTSSTATAIVVIERTAGPGDAVRGDAVTARFVRVKQGSVDDPALRMVGVGMDIPLPGACFAPSELDDRRSTQGRVELLDVGQVNLTQMSTQNAPEASRNIVLLPRTMPDPANIMSGVFYSARSADAFSAGSRISLRSNGGADLTDGFSVSVNTPHDLTEVHVAFITSGTAMANGLDVSWDTTDADAHDLVYVDVLSPAPRVMMRCTGTDVGHLVVPQGSIAGIDEGQLAVHRLHKESFKAKGIEPGEVRFDVAKIVTFRR